MKLGFIIFFLYMAVGQSSAAQNTVHLGSLEYPPYTGKNLKNEGFVTEIVRAAFKRVGYQVNIVYYPWARAVKMAELGDIDGIVNIWERVDRMSWIFFSDPMPDSELVFYKRKGIEIPFDGTHYLTLKPYKIGTGRGYANPEQFDAVKDQLQIHIVNNDIQNLNKLAIGRIDLVIIDKFVAQFILSTKLPAIDQVLDYIEIPLSIEPSRLGISRKALQAERKLVDFNRGLSLLRREGAIEAILIKHGLR